MYIIQYKHKNKIKLHIYIHQPKQLSNNKYQVTFYLVHCGLEIGLLIVSPLGPHVLQLGLS